MPYHVSINFRNYHLCGGALISSTWILTSATCASLTETPQIRLGAEIYAPHGMHTGTCVSVRYFTFFIRRGSLIRRTQYCCHWRNWTMVCYIFYVVCIFIQLSRITAAKRVIHQSYEPTSSDYDIALFKHSFNTLWLFNLFDWNSMNHVGLANWLKPTRLSKPASLNRYVKTVSLPSSCVSSGSRCLITGWGNMSRVGSNYPARLRVTEWNNQELPSDLFTYCDHDITKRIFFLYFRQKGPRRPSC